VPQLADPSASSTRRGDHKPLAGGLGTWGEGPPLDQGGIEPERPAPPTKGAPAPPVFEPPVAPDGMVPSLDWGDTRPSKTGKPGLGGSADGEEATTTANGGTGSPGCRQATVHPGGQAVKGGSGQRLSWRRDVVRRAAERRRDICAPLGSTKRVAPRLGRDSRGKGRDALASPEDSAGPLELQALSQSTSALNAQPAGVIGMELEPHEGLGFLHVSPAGCRAKQGGPSPPVPVKMPPAFPMSVSGNLVGQWSSALPSSGTRFEAPMGAPNAPAQKTTDPLPVVSAGVGIVAARSAITGGAAPVPPERSGSLGEAPEGTLDEDAAWGVSAASAPGISPIGTGAQGGGGGGGGGGLTRPQEYATLTIKSETLAKDIADSKAKQTQHEAVANVYAHTYKTDPKREQYESYSRAAQGHALAQQAKLAADAEHKKQESAHAFEALQMAEAEEKRAFGAMKAAESGLSGTDKTRLRTLKEKEKEERDAAAKQKAKSEVLASQQIEKDDKRNRIEAGLSDKDKARADKDIERFLRDQKRDLLIQARLKQKRDARLARNEARSNYKTTQAAKARRAGDKADRLKAKAGRLMAQAGNPNLSRSTRKDLARQAKEKYRQAADEFRKQAAALKEAGKDEEAAEALRQATEMDAFADWAARVEIDPDLEGDPPKASPYPCGEPCDCNISCEPPMDCICRRVPGPVEPGGPGPGPGPMPGPAGGGGGGGRGQQLPQAGAVADAEPDVEAGEQEKPDEPPAAEDRNRYAGPDKKNGAKGENSPPVKRGGRRKPRQVAPPGVFDERIVYARGDGGQPPPQVPPPQQEAATPDGTKTAPDETEVKAPEGTTEQTTAKQPAPCNEFQAVLERDNLLRVVVQAEILFRVVAALQLQKDQKEKALGHLMASFPADLAALSFDQTAMAADVAAMKDLFKDVAVNVVSGMAISAVKQIGSRLITLSAPVQKGLELGEFVYDAASLFLDVKSVYDNAIRSNNDADLRGATDRVASAFGDLMAQSLTDPRVIGPGRERDPTGENLFARNRAIHAASSLRGAALELANALDRSDLIPDHCKKHPYFWSSLPPNSIDIDWYDIFGLFKKQKGGQAFDNVTDKALTTWQAAYEKAKADLRR